MKAERLLYLGYHFKKADYRKLSAFREYVREKNGISAAGQWRDAIRSSLEFNISLDDYYLFRFFEKDKEERSLWAGTGYMYEFQKQMNPPSVRNILEDKMAFYDTYGEFIRHRFMSAEDIRRQTDKTRSFLSGTRKVVLKHSRGQCGNGIEILDSENLTPEKLAYRLETNGNDMAEEFVQQHPDLEGLSPSGLNTVRIITQLDQNDKVHILGARLRITVDSCVDNMAAGNIAASIDEETGIVEGPAVYSDITKESVKTHPVTGVKISGFQTPFWAESVELVKRAALKDTRNRSIGWDVAITEESPELIEGNHDWCKLLWQLPVKKGLKHKLDQFLKID